MEVTIKLADLTDPIHAQAVLDITNAYALDKMGGGKPLTEFVWENLIEGLKSFSGTRIFLAFDGDEAIGLANCFIGFSTFYAKQLINIHDLAVMPEYRGKGIGQSLLNAVAEYAKENDFCKVTLEVLEHNPAKKLYERSGFDSPYLFMSKVIE